MVEALDTCRLLMRHTGYHQRISVSFLLLSILWLQKTIALSYVFVLTRLVFLSGEEQRSARPIS